MLTNFCSWFEGASWTAFFNSAFTTSLVGALAGAYFGARAAQNGAEFAKLREAAEAELRSINVAIALASSVLNNALALKSQFVQGLHERYQAEVARHTAWQSQWESGERQGNAAFRLKTDFTALQELKAPTTQLREVVLFRINNAGRPLSLATAIDENLDRLNWAIAARNKLIDDFKAGRFQEGADLPKLYLGLPYREGHVSTEYGDLVEGIATYNDAVVFLTHLLARDLMAHGEKASKAYKEAFKTPSLRVGKLNFDQAKKDGLLPPDEDYPSWFSNFVKATDEAAPGRISRMLTTLKLWAVRPRGPSAP